jgi:four helix bundle protein
MIFNHEKLNVYQRILSFNANVAVWSGTWDSKHAIRDQLSRAAGSMLENLAMASAAFSTMKHRALDYAIGSSLECAACLDLARAKLLLETEDVRTGKDELLHILRMLVGLRKSWVDQACVIKEGCSGYVAESGIAEDSNNEVDEQHLFHHETLDVYKVSIKMAMVFYASEAVSCLPTSAFRRLDELLTSMVLNIAEGNGRFSKADQARFLGTSHESVIKLAARLDLCVTQNLLPQNEVIGWKALLERVSVMTSSMIMGLKL